jgi:hypothetical protein
MATRRRRDTIRDRQLTVSELFERGTPIDQALRRGVREALLRHKRLGRPVATWQRGRVVVLQATKFRSVGRLQRRDSFARTPSGPPGVVADETALTKQPPDDPGPPTSESGSSGPVSSCANRRGLHASQGPRQPSELPRSLLKFSGGSVDDYATCETFATRPSC